MYFSIGFRQQSTITNTKEIVGRTSTSCNSSQQTASIIVVTAAMTPTVNVVGTTTNRSIGRYNFTLCD